MFSCAFACTVACINFQTFLSILFRLCRKRMRLLLLLLFFFLFCFDKTLLNIKETVTCVSAREGGVGGEDGGGCLQKGSSLSTSRFPHHRPFLYWALFITHEAHIHAHTHTQRNGEIPHDMHEASLALSLSRGAHSAEPEWVLCAPLKHTEAHEPHPNTAFVRGRRRVCACECTCEEGRTRLTFPITALTPARPKIGK